MRKLMILAAALAATGAGLFVAWRRNPRLGTRTVNEVVNPLLVQRGIAGAGRSEIGTLEHVGRTSGTRHLTPVHPVPIEGGFRIVVPLGEQSQWVRNVVAAGHCRLHLHDTVYELDEPVRLAPSETPGIVPPVAWLMDRLGMEYLLLHTFAEHPGGFDANAEPTSAEAAPAAESPVAAGA